MKKVLVIVYYWPPSGGAGVQRWLKFVKYLPLFGWQPTVITTYNGDYPAIDESLLTEVPARVKVIRTKTPTFGGLFKKGTEENVPYGSLESKPDDSVFKKIAIWIRLNLIVPDARKVWNKYALQAATNELRINKYNAVITSGPPHSTHLVGLKLKQIFNMKWLADFRDPWTKIDYLDASGRVLKTETRRGYFCEQGVCLPRKQRMVDHTKGGMFSELTLLEHRINPSLPDTIFSKRNLRR